MEDRKLRWGLLSTAKINRALIPPLLSSDRNVLLAVASRTQERAQAYAQEKGIPRAYGSYEELLADPEIEVIYNPLPNSLHAEWTIRAAQAGKHVLCEKPLALTVDEVDRIAYAAQMAGVVVAEAFMYRSHPQTLKAKELVESGSLGQIQYLRGSFSFLLNRPEDVRLDRDLGGGSIWDVGCYPISYARLLAGSDPVEVFGWQVASASGVDTLFAGQLRFSDGILAQFDSAFSLPYRTQFEVVGSQGRLLIPSPFKPDENERMLLFHNDQRTEFEIQADDLYLYEVEDMYESIVSGQPPRVSLADSRGNVATIAALVESARLGRPMPVAF